MRDVEMPNSHDEILDAWRRAACRDAERRLASSPAGTPEFFRAQYDVARLRESYRLRLSGEVLAPRSAAESAFPAH
jgi:hypothetical protein